MYVQCVSDGVYFVEGYVDWLGKVNVGKVCVRFWCMLDVDFDVLCELLVEVVWIGLLV